MLDSNKRLLANLSAIDRGLEKLECVRGNADFRNSNSVWSTVREAL